MHWQEMVLNENWSHASTVCFPKIKEKLKHVNYVDHGQYLKTECIFGRFCKIESFLRAINV